MIHPAQLRLALALVAGCGGSAAPLHPIAPAEEPLVIAAPPEVDDAWLGGGPLVRFRRLELRGGGGARIPGGRCQETIVRVLGGRGKIAIDGAETRFEERTTLRPSIGKSFVVTGEPDARLLLVVGREARHSCDPAGEPEPSPLIVVRDGDAAPFVHAEGRLRVSLWVDAVAGARFATLGFLDGDADLPVPEHVHETSVEALYFEDGAGTMRIGGRQVRIAAGAVAYVPAGTLHGYMPDGTRPLRAFQVYAPPGPEQRFRAGSTAPIVDVDVDVNGEGDGDGDGDEVTPRPSR